MKEYLILKDLQKGPMMKLNVSVYRAILKIFIKKGKMTEITILPLSIIISLIAGAFIAIRQSKKEKEKLNIKINELQNDKVKLENEKSLRSAKHNETSTLSGAD